MSMPHSRSYRRELVAFFCLLTSVLLLPLFSWHFLVSSEVQEPYLDEVFHVRQAQTYCRGDLQTWDPKITTPPGLYLVNHILNQMGVSCNISTLRLTNVLFLAAGVAPLAFIYRSSWSSSLVTGSWSLKDGPRVQRLIADAHTALNIALFPPLFFFAALYYTDIASTALILGVLVIYKLRDTYAHDSAEEFLRVLAFGIVAGFALHKQWTLIGVATAAVYMVQLPLRPRGFDGSKQDNAPTRSEPVMRRVIIILGIAALTFRQTNIFWIAAFPAAMSLLNELNGRATGQSSLSDTLRDCAFSRTFYNPLIANASLEDMGTSVLSIAACLLGIANFMATHPFSLQAKNLLNRVAPYLSLTMLFIAFVLVNGGIVLGDKSNHVATIHMPQMLYIWPYMCFFSAPVVLPGMLGSLLPSSVRPRFLRPYAIPLQPSLVLMAVAVVLLASMLAVVHANTIIHPFTLADNRHYVFYIFRILRLHPELFYLATPVYLMSAWGVIRSLGISAQKTDRASGKSTMMNQGPGLNFLLAWFATSTLCLIGAPLVEPRYYILPWVLWRLEVPSPHDPIEELPEPQSSTPVVTGSISTARESNTQAVQRRRQTPSMEKPDDDRSSVSSRELAWQELFFSDYRLWLETVWHLGINAVTAYVFLYKGFEWIQEPGQVQRFLW